MNRGVLEILEENNISYIIISGKYDEESYKTEEKEFKPDLDIISKTKSFSIISKLFNKERFKILEENSIFDKQLNLRVDMYFKSVNVGYYHFLIPNNHSYKLKHLAEEDYIIYQILDPLLKFSKYHNRHKFRLSKYFKNGIPKDLSLRLSKIIGVFLTKILLNRIYKSEYIIEKQIIRLIKIRILFINGNFVKMFNVRFDL